MPCGRIYRLQMQIKKQHSVVKISNNEENVIYPANRLSLWSTPLNIDHKIRDWLD